MYSDETSGRLPPGVMYEGHPTAMTTWDRSIQKYVGSDLAKIPASGDPVDPTRDTFSCPSDKKPRSVGRARSYSMLYFDDPINPINPKIYEYRVSVPLARFPSPSEDFLIAEWQYFGNIRLANGPGCIINPYYYNAWPVGDLVLPAEANYHRSGNMFLFVDGHVVLLDTSRAYINNQVHWNWQNLR